jgi:vacuolar-type H+-ATPase subunit H
MAEAAMRLNRVFEAADSAAKEYLSNMELIANSLLDDARRKAARIIKDAEQQARIYSEHLEEQNDPQRENRKKGTADTFTGGTE